MNKQDQEFIVQKIRTEYMEKEHHELDALRELDAEVKRPAKWFAYTWGILGALVMGSGMSLVMTEINVLFGIEAPTYPGIAIGVAGMAMTIATYPIYKMILDSRRKKYADQIIALSDKIMK